MSLSTSFAISEAVNNSLLDDSVKTTALMLMTMKDSLDDDSFREFLFQYSANLVSVTASLVTEIFMTQEQIEEMVREAKELKELGDSLQE